MSHIIKNKKNLIRETEDHPGKANNIKVRRPEKGKYKKEI